MILKSSGSFQLNVFRHWHGCRFGGQLAIAKFFAAFFMQYEPVFCSTFRFRHAPGLCCCSYQHLPGNSAGFSYRFIPAANSAAATCRLIAVFFFIEWRLVNY